MVTGERKKLGTNGTAMYMEANVTEEGIHETSVLHMPIALAFEIVDEKYILKEFWTSGDGAYYVKTIREKFPADIAEQAMDTQNTVYQQTMDCFEQVIRQSGLNPDSIIDKLLEQICSADISSATEDYIKNWPIEFRELIYYGQYSLDYKNRYLSETQDLKAAVMEEACKRIQEFISGK